MSSVAPLAWGEDIDPDRQRELRNRFHRGFAGIRLSGADVYWLAACTLAAISEGQRLADASPGGIINAQHRLKEAKDNVLLRVSLDFSALNLSGALLSGAYLAGAVLGKVTLTGATLGAAHLRGAYLGGARLEGAFLDRAELGDAVLRGARLERASLRWAEAPKADLGAATLNDAILRNANLTEASVIKAKLERVDLREGKLQSANFIEANLTDAYLYEAHLEGALFTDANLTGCDLRRASLSGETRLNGAQLNLASLEQLRLGDTNLAVVEWPEVKELGDEMEAREAHKRVYRYNSGPRERLKGQRKKRDERVKDYRAASRAYRALAVALDGQGLSRDATRFQYKAEVMARKTSFHQGNLIRWTASGALDFFAGYGIHQIWRLLITYLAAIGLFAFVYYAIGRWGVPAAPLSPPEALVLSFTSFHGRGLMPSTDLSDPMRYVAIGEAIVGVLVEALLVAALVRRITGN